MKEFIVKPTKPEAVKAFEENNFPQLIRCKNCKKSIDHSEYFRDSRTRFYCSKDNIFYDGEWYCGAGEPKDTE